LLRPWTHRAYPVNDHSPRAGSCSDDKAEEGTAADLETCGRRPAADCCACATLPDGAGVAAAEVGEEAGWNPADCGLSMNSALLPLHESYEAVEESPGRQVPGRTERQPQAQLAEQRRGELRAHAGKDEKALEDALADLFEIEDSGGKGRGKGKPSPSGELVGFYTPGRPDAARRGRWSWGLMRLKGSP